MIVSGLWGVVNNAAQNIIGDIELTTMEQYSRLAEVNLTGAIRVTKAFLPMIRKSKGTWIGNANQTVNFLIPQFFLFFFFPFFCQWKNSLIGNFVCQVALLTSPVSEAGFRLFLGLHTMSRSMAWRCSPIFCDWKWRNLALQCVRYSRVALLVVLKPLCVDPIFSQSASATLPWLKHFSWTR